MNLPMLDEWLTQEYAHSLRKFPHSYNKEGLHHLTSAAHFGGTAQQYWNRLQLFRAGQAYQQSAQSAGKIASSARVLYATIRAYDRDDAKSAFRDAWWIAEKDRAPIYAKNFIDKPDFNETPIGMGIGYLAEYIQKQGIEKSLSRHGALVRAGEILVHSVAVMDFAFEECESQGLALPKPGLSSGNIEPWTTA